MGWMFRVGRGTEITEDTMPDDGVSVLKITNGASQNGVLLYLHGGAYVFGSAQTHKRIVAHMVRLAGMTGISVNYRLAPEHKFPAALDDAISVYQEILTRGTSADKIIIAGDSAGGGLALALLGRILAEGLPKPAGLFAFSPWTDLTLSGESMETNDRSEYLLPPKRIREARDFYCPEGQENPQASPLFADFRNAPPVLLFVGSTEVLRDDSIRIAEQMKQSGVDVQLNIYENTPHVWPIFHGKLLEADQAMSEVAIFIRSILKPVAT